MTDRAALPVQTIVIRDGRVIGASRRALGIGGSGRFLIIDRCCEQALGPYRAEAILHQLERGRYRWGNGGSGSSVDR